MSKYNVGDYVLFTNGKVRQVIIVQDSLFGIEYGFLEYGFLGLFRTYKTEDKLVCRMVREQSGGSEK